MNVASLELCKELWAVSHWPAAQQWHVDSQAHICTVGGHGGEQYPAYDLGYLLRKLTEKGQTYGHDIQLEYTHDTPDGSKWECFIHIIPHQNFSEEADTPEDAACTLAIELFKKGVLK